MTQLLFTAIYAACMTVFFYASLRVLRQDTPAEELTKVERETDFLVSGDQMIVLVSGILSLFWPIGTVLLLVGLFRKRK